MADRARIADLWGGYGAGNDLRDLDLLESCFTEDMSFTVHIAGGDTWPAARTTASPPSRSSATRWAWTT
jgi:hypothetical protein